MNFNLRVVYKGEIIFEKDTVAPSWLPLPGEEIEICLDPKKNREWKYPDRWSILRRVFDYSDGRKEAQAVYLHCVPSYDPSNFQSLR